MLISCTFLNCERAPWTIIQSRKTVFLSSSYQESRVIKRTDSINTNPRTSQLLLVTSARQFNKQPWPPTSPLSLLLCLSSFLLWVLTTLTISITFTLTWNLFYKVYNSTNIVTVQIEYLFSWESINHKT